jgi:hypothetical protein
MTTVLQSHTRPTGKFQDRYAYLLATGTTVRKSLPSPLAYAVPLLSDEPTLRSFRVQRVRIPRQRFISNTPANFDSNLDPTLPLVNERKSSHPENMYVSWTHREGMTCSAYYDMQIQMAMRGGDARAIITRRQTLHRTPVCQYLVLTSATMSDIGNVQ